MGQSIAGGVAPHHGPIQQGAGRPDPATGKEAPQFLQGAFTPGNGKVSEAPLLHAFPNQFLTGFVAGHPHGNRSLEPDRFRQVGLIAGIALEQPFKAQGGSQRVAPVQVEGSQQHGGLSAGISVQKRSENVGKLFQIAFFTRLFELVGSCLSVGGLINLPRIFRQKGNNSARKGPDAHIFALHRKTRNGLAQAFHQLRIDPDENILAGFNQSLEDGDRLGPILFLQVIRGRFQTLVQFRVPGQLDP